MKGNNGKHFYMLIKNLFYKTLHIRKHVIITDTAKRPKTIVLISATLYDSVFKKASTSVAAIHIEPSIDRETHISLLREMGKRKR